MFPSDIARPTKEMRRRDAIVHTGAMEITPAQRTALRELSERHDLSLVVLFGSHAGGPTHAASDLDIAVRTRSGGGLSTEAWLELQERLRGVFPDHPVDLAVIDRADPLFLKQIASRSVLITKGDGFIFSARRCAGALRCRPVPGRRRGVPGPGGPAPCRGPSCS